MNTRTGFTRKKVESLTLGEKLKKIRQEYHITLGEVTKNTGIPVKHLERLEGGRYDELPSDVYVRGFLRSYGRFLGADEVALIKRYERERGVYANLKQEADPRSAREAFRLPRFVVTPKVLASVLVGMLVLGGFLYLYREYQAFVSAPYLVILEPANGSAVDGGSVSVRGRTDKEATLTINRQPTLINADGEFSEVIRLQPGLNTLVISAVNKFKKEAIETLTLRADYGDAAPASVGDGTNP